MSLFVRSSTLARRMPAAVSRRVMSTAYEAKSAGGSGALALAVGTTFVTYMTADFLSNFI